MHRLFHRFEASIYVVFMLTLFKVFKTNTSTVSQPLSSDGGVSVVYPRVYNAIPRRRRDINSNVYNDGVEDKLKIVQLGNWVLQLNADHNLIFTEGFSSQWVNENGGKRKRRNPSQPSQVCDYKIGRVVNGEETRVALTICGTEIRGYIHDGFHSYFVEPANNGSNAHYLFKGNGVSEWRVR